MITADNLITKCEIYINSSSTRVEPSDWYQFFTDSIRDVRKGRTFPEQKRKITMDFFTDVHQYPLPTDFDAFVKPRNEIEQLESPYLIYGTDKEFYANQQHGLAVEHDKENKYLLARIAGKADLLVEGFDGDAEDYTRVEDANTLSSNEYQHKEGAKSIQFNLTSNTGMGSVYRTLSEALDISDFVDYNGSAFIWVYMPAVVNSVRIKIGSDSGNYYHLIATSRHTGEPFAVGWNLLRVDFSQAILNGAPDKTACDFVRIDLYHTDVTATGFILDGLFLRLPTEMEMPYLSKYVVKSNAGTYQETVSAGTDNILPEDTFESVVMWDSVWRAGAFKMKDKDITELANNERAKAIKDLNRRYPSTEAPIQANYYRNNKF